MRPIPHRPETEGESTDTRDRGVTEHSPTTHREEPTDDEAWLTVQEF